MRGLEEIPQELRDLLGVPIKDLGLKLQGSPVEWLVETLHRELGKKGLNRFRPACYLTDEWGCPSGQPVIGIPFYLADRRLSELERTINDLESDTEILMYLRHEAGHAFNYAYQLYRTETWRQIFGPYHRPYRDHYRPVLFSRDYVRHIPGWYAQKHPDEDFAETFAVWLTPRSGWRRRYRGSGAMRKLLYVDRLAREIRERDPLRKRGKVDFSVEDMDVTLGDFYRRSLGRADAVSNLVSDSDLEHLFPRVRSRKGRRPASDVLAESRQSVVDQVSDWTGVSRPLVRDLVERARERVEALGLSVEKGREQSRLVALTAYLTALAVSTLSRPKKPSNDVK